MPCLRDSSATGVPASSSFRMPMICSSVSSCLIFRGARDSPTTKRAVPKATGRKNPAILVLKLSYKRDGTTWSRGTVSDHCSQTECEMADQTFASCRGKFKGPLLPGPAFSARRKERVPTSSRWGLEAIIRRGSFIALSVVALVCLGRPQAAAGQSPSVTLFVQTVGADSRVTEHRDGDAIPIGARYRVQIGNL